MTIQDALDYCLENPEGLSAEDLLSRFPQYRDELASLLGVATGLGSFDPPAVPAAHRAAMKARLMQSAAARPAIEAAAAAPTVPIQAINRPSPALSQPSTARSRRPLPWFLKPGWVVAAAALLLISFVWWSAANALPDNPFYGIRLASESFTLGLSGSDIAKTQGRISLANNRLYDLRAMQQRGKLAQAQQAFDSYSSNLNNSVKMWSGLTGQPNTNVAGLLYASSQAGKVTFHGFDSIANSLPAAMQEQIRATEAVLDDSSAKAEQSLVAANIDPSGVLSRAGSDIAPLLTPVVPIVIAVPTFTPTGDGQPSPTSVVAATNTPTAAPPTPTATATETAVPPSPTSSDTPTLTLSNTPTPVPPTVTPTRRPPAPSRTPTVVHVRPSPTRRPPPPPTHTPMPPAPTLPPIVPSATFTTTATITPEPEPQPRSCDLRIRDVSTSCPGGCVGWRATVENRGDATIDADWTAELQIKVKGGGFEAVAEEHGSTGFSPGDTTLDGEICYDFPPNTDKLRVELYVEGDNCNLPSHKSKDASPCK